MTSVVFVKGHKGDIVTSWENRTAFPDRRGPQPNNGEEWEVMSASSNPRGTVYFLSLGKKVERPTLTLPLTVTIDRLHTGCLDRKRGISYGKMGVRAEIEQKARALWGIPDGWLNISQYVDVDPQVADGKYEASVTFAYIPQLVFIEEIVLGECLVNQDEIDKESDRIRQEREKEREEAERLLYGGLTRQEAIKSGLITLEGEDWGTTYHSTYTSW